MRKLSGTQTTRVTLKPSPQKPVVMPTHTTSLGTFFKSHPKLSRAFKTFVQAFVAVFLAGVPTSINNVQLKALVVAAFAAALSAVSNYYFDPQEG